MFEVFESLRDSALHIPHKQIIVGDEVSLDYASLIASIIALMHRIPTSAHTVAIAGKSGLLWIIADLAVTLMSRRLVPMPPFFSAVQLSNLCGDADVDLVICCGSSATDLNLDAGFSCIELGLKSIVHAPGLVLLPAYHGGAERVIYTSGTTGHPKGVLHGDRQLSYSIDRIATAVHARETDIHLTALPYALLLEQIAGIFVPLVVGAQMHSSATAVDAALAGNIRPLLDRLVETQASTMILVPQLLRALVAELRQSGGRLSESLRFVAVGGAPVAPELVQSARELGLPVYRGYGLSECCSVVSLEREGSAAKDGAGKVLEGVSLSIEDGEIVVSGGSVMNGYLNATPLEVPVWHTGDLGHIEDDGTLVIDGRKDRVIVLANGRNLSPKWVEALVLADTRFIAAQLNGHGQMRPELALVVDHAARVWVEDILDTNLGLHPQALFSELPDYALPARVAIFSGSMETIALRSLELAGVAA